MENRSAMAIRRTGRRRPERAREPAWRERLASQPAPDHPQRDRPSQQAPPEPEQLERLPRVRASPEQQACHPRTDRHQPEPERELPELLERPERLAPGLRHRRRDHPSQEQPVRLEPQASQERRRRASLQPVLQTDHHPQGLAPRERLRPRQTDHHRPERALPEPVLRGPERLALQEQRRRPASQRLEHRMDRHPPGLAPEPLAWLAPRVRLCHRQTDHHRQERALPEQERPEPRGLQEPRHRLARQTGHPQPALEPEQALPEPRHPQAFPPEHRMDRPPPEPARERLEPGSPGRQTDHRQPGPGLGRESPGPRHQTDHPRPELGPERPAPEQPGLESRAHRTDRPQPARELGPEELPGQSPRERLVLAEQPEQRPRLLRTDRPARERSDRRLPRRDGEARRRRRVLAVGSGHAVGPIGRQIR